MNICFISYWGINEGLTQATVLPHIRILKEFDQVDRVFLITMERSTPQADQDVWPDHYPVKTSHRISDKILDQTRAKRKLRRLLESEKIDLLIARSVHAAWICEQLAARYHVPYVVESFEPHTDYMIEEGIWKANGLKARLLKRSELKQREGAKKIMTVTERYRAHLIEQGVPAEKVLAVPCTADPEVFQYDPAVRKQMRENASIGDDTVVGLYTGKFGGIYLADEALQLFLEFKQLVEGAGKQFYLVILSPDREHWQRELERVGIPEQYYEVGFVPQQEVWKYCNMADLAFSLHRPRPSKMAISPIKNAEFWLTGLPIVTTPGIGDDSTFVLQNDLGVQLNAANKLNESDLEKLLALIGQDRANGHIRKWAQLHRTYDVVRSGYEALLAELGF